MKGAAEHDLELIQLDRFVEEVVGPFFHGAQGILLFTAPRDDDHLGLAVLIQNFIEDGKPLLDARRKGGKAEIEGDHRRLFLPHHGRGAWPVLRQQDLIVLGQGPLHLRPQILVVIDDQKLLFSRTLHNSTLYTIPTPALPIERSPAAKP